jgi:hypothetical protein
MKRRQRSRFDLMGRKRDTVQRRDDDGRRRHGTEEGKREKMTPVGLTRILLGQKIKKIHTIDLVGTNGR